mmetsp:Transcript_104758/g.295133  ORF Transcript_104758/g.295133 Transcript_104758/m.295133 type:complete len:419 (-) Transcript_104758:136-1392(-)
MHETRGESPVVQWVFVLLSCSARFHRERRAASSFEAPQLPQRLGNEFRVDIDACYSRGACACDKEGHETSAATKIHHRSPCEKRFAKMLQQHVYPLVDCGMHVKALGVILVVITVGIHGLVLTENRPPAQTILNKSSIIPSAYPASAAFAASGHCASANSSLASLDMSHTRPVVAAVRFAPASSMAAGPRLRFFGRRRTSALQALTLRREARATGLPGASHRATFATEACSRMLARHANRGCIRLSASANGSLADCFLSHMKPIVAAATPAPSPAAAVGPSLGLFDRRRPSALQALTLRRDPRATRLPSAGRQAAFVRDACSRMFCWCVSCLRLSACAAIRGWHGRRRVNHRHQFHLLTYHCRRAAIGLGWARIQRSAPVCGFRRNAHPHAATAIDRRVAGSLPGGGGVSGRHLCQRR